MASSVLATVYYAGWHHLVEVEDWPDKLADVVLDAVRHAPRINGDAALESLDRTGHPDRPGPRSDRDG